MLQDPSQFAVHAGGVERLLVALVRAQRIPVVGRLVVRQLLRLQGTDIPHQTLRPGRLLVLQHGGRVVVHASTRIGDDVVILQGATIGRGDLWQEPAPDYGGVVVEDGVIIGAGAVVLVSRGTLTLGRGSVVGANAVLTRSTGPHEIWAGNPATCRGLRPGAGRPERHEDTVRTGDLRRAATRVTAG